MALQLQGDALPCPNHPAGLARFKRTAHRFEIRGDVGMLSGVAFVWTQNGYSWSIAGICLDSPLPSGAGRTIDPFGFEFVRLHDAVIRQDSERINDAVAALSGSEDA